VPQERSEDEIMEKKLRLKELTKYWDMQNKSRKDTESIISE
jgi:hypothetical protein